MEILVIIPRCIFQKKMSRVRFHTLKYLSKISNVVFWGDGWADYNSNISLCDNLKIENKTFNVIILYKPINLGKLPNSMLCIQYNEMWDIELTKKEIIDNKLNLIICHHENDMINYINNKFPHLTYFEHIPHCADPTIFFDNDNNHEIDVLLVGAIGRHYPLRKKMKQSIELFDSKYKVVEFIHPGYLHEDSFTDKYLHDMANTIRRTKICMTCSSSYKYALGKYVEIAMCGAVTASDIPNQDNYKEFCIEILDSDTPIIIKDKITKYLENNDLLLELRKKSLEWSKKHTHQIYAERYLNIIKASYMKFSVPKIYIMGEEMRDGTKWICDWFKDEVYSNCKPNNKYELVDDANKADIIWLIAPWSRKKLNCDLSKKYVISTIHHIDVEKYKKKEVMDNFREIESITNKFHTICNSTTDEFCKISTKQYTEAPFWANDLIFKPILNKRELREKWKIPKDSYVIGSFQKDSEGQDITTPKLCKGPDLLIDILKREKNDNLLVLLSGWKRNYIINELEKANINYLYYEMVSREELNELYNCLDLYIVSSRVEGGPMAIYEYASSKTPIISTDVGISRNILPPECIFDMNKIDTYKYAISNIELAYKNVNKISILNGYIEEFISKVLLSK